MEFRLSESDRFVIGNTQSRVVAEFWYCAMQDADKISLMADKIFPLLNEATFDILRKRLILFYPFQIKDYSETGRILVLSYLYLYKRHHHLIY